MNPAMPYRFVILTLSGTATIDIEETSWDIPAKASITGPGAATVKDYLQVHGIGYHGHIFGLDAVAPSDLHHALLMNETTHREIAIKSFDVIGYVPEENPSDEDPPEGWEEYGEDDGDEDEMLESLDWRDELYLAMREDRHIFESTDDDGWRLQPSVLGVLKGKALEDVRALGFDTDESVICIDGSTIVYIRDKHGSQLTRDDEKYLRLAVTRPTEILPNIGKNGVLGTAYRSKSVLMVYRADKDYLAIVEIGKKDGTNVVWNFWKLSTSKANKYLAKYRREKARILADGGATVNLPHVPRNTPVGEAGKSEGLSESHQQESGSFDSPITKGGKTVKPITESATDGDLRGDVPTTFITPYHGKPHVNTILERAVDGHDRPKTICVDFDGVIADYSKGFQGADVFGEPLHGAASSMSALKEAGWKIIIFTTRKDTPALRKYLQDNAIPWDEINQNTMQPEGANPGKPIADLYLDDRAMRFRGWADARYAIQSMTDEGVFESATAEEVHAAAHEAATSHLNDLPEPTQAMKEAGNYRKGRIRLHGLEIAIENPKGSTRKGVDADGKEWCCTLPAHYGDIKRSIGADNDAVDIYIGDHPESELVFVIDQIDHMTGRFDEHKVVAGVMSQKQARDLYIAGFSDGKGAKRLGAMTAMHMPEFKEWLRNGDTKRPMSGTVMESAGDYASKILSATSVEEIAGVFRELWPGVVDRR